MYPEKTFIKTCPGSLIFKDSNATAIEPFPKGRMPLAILRMYQSHKILNQHFCYAQATI
jgi:hypothetical protein